MHLSQLQNLLTEHPQRSLQLILPSGNPIPQAFHITEVGRIEKTFLDCGGTLRHLTTCQLQIWLGHDLDHHLETQKIANILTKATTYLPNPEIPVEIEYEHPIITQFTISHHSITPQSIILHLTHKRTECLAPELCGLGKFPEPTAPNINFSIPPLPNSNSNCCGPNGCC